MHDLSFSLAKNIKRFRKLKKLTQNELSDKAGVAYSTIAKLEQGAIKSPSLSTSMAIAEVLDLSLEELISDSKHRQTISKVPVKIIYFDVNGVVVRFFHKAFTLLSRKTDLHVEKIENVFWHYNTAGNRGEITMSQFNKYLGEELEIKNFKWQDYYFKSIEPITEVSDFIKEIAGKIDVGLLTNTFPGLVDSMLEEKMIPNVEYKAIVDSSKIGSVKPELKIYEEAEKMSGYSGEEILFVDNSRNNLIAASRLNWRSLWFDDLRPKESINRMREALEDQFGKSKS
jgi:HAD superfamily hydrolase (TIGR01509 family)